MDYVQLGLFFLCPQKYTNRPCLLIASFKRWPNSFKFFSLCHSLIFIILMFTVLLTCLLFSTFWSNLVIPLSSISFTFQLVTVCWKRDQTIRYIWHFPTAAVACIGDVNVWKKIIHSICIWCLSWWDRLWGWCWNDWVVPEQSGLKCLTISGISRIYELFHETNSK